MTRTVRNALGRIRPHLSQAPNRAHRAARVAHDRIRSQDDIPETGGACLTTSSRQLAGAFTPAVLHLYSSVEERRPGPAEGCWPIRQ